MSAPAHNRYKALVELQWDNEPFDGDPDDVYELAELEKEHLIKQLEQTMPWIGENGTVNVAKVTPVILEG